HSFVHGQRCNRPRSRYDTGAAAVPNLRALRGRAAAAERSSAAVVSHLRTACTKTARLVAARTRAAKPVLRRGDECADLRTAHPDTGRTRPAERRFLIELAIRAADKRNPATAARRCARRRPRRR